MFREDKADGEPQRRWPLWRHPKSNWPMVNYWDCFEHHWDLRYSYVVLPQPTDSD